MSIPIRLRARTRISPSSTEPQRTQRSGSKTVRSSPALSVTLNGLPPSTTATPRGMSRWSSSRSIRVRAASSISATISSPSSARSRSIVSHALRSGGASKRRPAATINANGAATTTSSGRRSASAATSPRAARPTYGASLGDANGVTCRRRRPRREASGRERGLRARHPLPSVAVPRAPASAGAGVRVPARRSP